MAFKFNPLTRKLDLVNTFKFPTTTGLPEIPTDGDGLVSVNGADGLLLFQVGGKNYYLTGTEYVYVPPVIPSTPVPNQLIGIFGAYTYNT